MEKIRKPATSTSNGGEIDSAVGTKITSWDSTSKLAGTDQTRGLYQAGLAPGQTSGAAIGTGYIGETLRSIQSSTVNIPGGSGAYGDALSLAITPGIWRISYGMRLSRNSATFSSTDILMGVSTTIGNFSTGLAVAVNAMNWALVIPTTFNTIDLAGMDFMVRFDGTTITRLDDNIAMAAGSTLYFKLYVATFSGAVPTYSAKLVATRIA